ncbi:MAG: glycosyltransferase [Bacteroidales bacterium]|nr:glycosyltransferase [Bacteroidales bacterium]
MSIKKFFMECKDGISAIILNDAELIEENIPEIKDESMVYHSPAVYMEGSVRDDFDFGDVLLVNNSLAAKAVELMDSDTEHCGIYDLRLMLSTLGNISKSSHPFYKIPQNSGEDFETAHFAYCDPRNRLYQIEAERVFTKYLRNTGALIKPANSGIDGFESIIKKYEYTASVVIPVKDRPETIADAVKSALGQITDFPMNVIVVNNHSQEATCRILSNLQASNPRLEVIVPEETDLGIGGCWNKAIASPKCGAIAIQLDSDDVYSSPHIVGKIVAKFMEERCGVLIGSYRLTDMNMNPLNDIIIDHREYTQENGANNALRVNGFGAPRCYLTDIARKNPFKNVSYGEDYDLCLRLSRQYKVARIFDVLYLCRRWEKNSDANLTPEKIVRFNEMKDSFRTSEILLRRSINKAQEL